MYQKAVRDFGTRRKKIFLVFAAREIQKKTSNVGLLEQDVIEMAEVIHKAEPHDIIFLEAQNDYTITLKLY